VLVAQLIDYLNAVWKRGEALAFDKENQLQPLQAFSPKYFSKTSGFTTYAKDWQSALHSGEKTQPNDTTQSIQAADIPHALTLQHLQRLLKQPVDVFIRDRLRLQLDVPDEASAQEEPFALNHLEKYVLTQTITKASDPTQALQRLRLSGELAIAGFGQAQESLLLSQREELLTRFNALVTDWPKTLTVQTQNWVFDAHSLNAEWANGQYIWRTNTDASAWLQVEMRPGSILEGKEKNKQARVEKLTTLWINHLVACASGTPTTSLQIGLNGVVRLDAITKKTRTPICMTWFFCMHKHGSSPYPSPVSPLVNIYPHLTHPKQVKTKALTNCMLRQYSPQVKRLRTVIRKLVNLRKVLPFSAYSKTSQT